uniref:Uncharacterized protein n=1 Tax=Chelonoidis abingdonii TaxID=106734 RepID=A0A8C0GHC0_CHEAB
MKILYLLFTDFFLVLQSSPGFSQCPAGNVHECAQNEGLCFGTCPAPFRETGSCGCGVSCCQWW